MNPKKNILMFVLNDVKNDPRVLKEAISLSSRYNVIIYGISDNNEVSEISNVQIKLYSLFASKLPSCYFTWVFMYIEIFIKIIYSALKEHIDYLHAHDLPALIPFLIISIVRKKKLIYDSHELFTETNYVSLRGFKSIWEKFEQFALNHCAYIIHANDSRATYMKKKYKVYCPLQSVYNYPKILTTNKIMLKPEVIMKIPQSKIICYQGVINESRCIELLIKSISMIEYDAALLLIGDIDNVYLKKLNLLINRLKLESKVYLIGHVPREKLNNILLYIDIGVIIYKNDCLNNYYCAPNKLYDYAFLKKPIIGSNLPEISAIISKYKIGLTFNNSTESIAHVINNVLLKYDHYSNGQYKELIVDHNWNLEESKLLNIYRYLNRNNILV